MPTVRADAVEVDAVVIGAGFSGLRALYELRDEVGLSVRLLEAGSDVGGVWYWNRYPGARCDSDSFTYCYSFSKELQEKWSWSERYATQPEILEYLHFVAEMFDLRRDIRLDSRVRSAVRDERENRWLVETADGQQYRCTYLVTAVGPLSSVFTPPFPGLDSFGGELYPAARWPAEPVGFTGKRVAIVGTGATSIQMTPMVAAAAARLTVFQRTAPYVLPARNRAHDPVSQQEIKAGYDAIWARTSRQTFALAIEDTDRLFAECTPEQQHRVMEQAWELGGFRLMFEAFADVMTDEACNEAVAGFVREKIRAIVDDPAVAELLCPKNSLTRPQLGHFYYETFNRDNVSLVDVSADPIAEVTASGIRTTSGREYGFDVIVFATGFDGGTGALNAIDIRGTDGRLLRDAWRDGPRAYLGLGAEGFPNLFMSFGPQSLFANAPVVSEHTARWIGRAISYLRDHGYQRMTPTPEAVDSWVRHVADAYYSTAFKHGASSRSWLVGANIPGKPIAPQLYVGHAAGYFARIAGEADAGFPGFDIPGRETGALR
ncbi:flavin-containing monooxygenase [Amycolatopsis jejuensis]|uniref:flavin-containing monooxygenase n=1 Tax=Amycolatopsis jejuensis TaxID=330084 RepID=UPI000524116C|nr:NAD(P)/FAD-dependent oxidoreductase [Amycolatopsis jejuensis]